ncbi:EF-P beta-lysylation protein EpmB [Salinisphaera sp. USBA-960]|uniref:EF-P beta-lysylation protein EpmB n=1 Tax=Salinisphaera orenii TaxID=856731 RepID=UPI000DBE3DD7|nr:EF-P beta-lysylation protein EpmB [Salifodinibacter halophilus]NNC26084.1 EF-P beta-lysylation protein EpmB [Salifodinibacter halophilus]
MSSLAAAHIDSATPDPIRDIDTLFNALSLPDDGRREAARRAAGLFGLRVPRHYLACMQPGDIDDPLLRQVLPIEAETVDSAGWVDAVGDRASSLGHGVLHKYHGRALLVTTGACAVHCRYCFRRHFDYAADHAGGSNEDQALALIAADTSICEVILSGGDPLSLTNQKLSRLLEKIESIAHVETLRLHSRTPIVDPKRLDDELIGRLADSRLHAVLVVHANHPHELSTFVTERLGKAASSDITLLNQSVLLSAVNNDVETLKQLSKKLFQARVLPYYLHLSDPVAGATHFDVDVTTATRLVASLSAHLPGYLVPKLTQEIAGEKAKTTYANSAY